LRTKKSGENTVTYEIRFRRDGYNICACGKTIELAKANFLSKCRGAMTDEITSNGVPTLFDDFSKYYFNTFRKEKVSEQTLRADLSRYKNYLYPYFKNTPLKNITPIACKTLIDGIKNNGKGKTADEIYSLLSVIFKSAIAHGTIERNPLNIVLHIQHERQSGKALTKDEEQRLKTALQGSQHLQAIMVLLYTGLRPNELKTARTDGNFIVAQNSKRKNKKIAYKKIPIINALKPYLDKPFNFANYEILRKCFKSVFPNHIIYDLRTTFYSRCDEFGVSVPARDEFVGHSNGALTNAYRDLSDDYLLKEGEKLNKWV
jgi:integrase